MTEDLGMDSNQYSIALIVFFITVGPVERLDTCKPFEQELM